MRRTTTKLSVRWQTGIEHVYISIGIDGDQGRVVGPTTEPIRIGVDLFVGSNGDPRRTKKAVDARYATDGECFHDADARPVMATIDIARLSRKRCG